MAYGKRLAFAFSVKKLLGWFNFSKTKLGNATVLSNENQINLKVHVDTNGILTALSTEIIFTLFRQVRLKELPLTEQSMTDFKQSRIADIFTFYCRRNRTQKALIM